MSDFYIGYLPKAPAPMARFVRWVVVALAAITIAAALVLLAGQAPFANSVFEYGKPRSFAGIIEARPYPTLVLARPGKVSENEQYSGYLLVAPGKHGADDLIAGFDGKAVRLQGQLIYRDSQTMIEIEPGSISEEEVSPTNPVQIVDLGAVTVSGEIVDSKCYLGVMNPGQGKVHRDCAARCISGGIPPILVTSDGKDQFLLVGTDRKAIGRDALREFIAEPITIRGELFQRGDTRLLQIDAGELRHETSSSLASQKTRLDPRR